MRVHLILTAIIFILPLGGCVDSPTVMPTATLLKKSTQAPSQTQPPTPSHTLTPTQTLAPTLIPTERPITIVFYGDSVLKVGDVSREGEVGYSILDVLQADLDEADQIITSNHGGRKAKWGYEHLEVNVLVHDPDIVTIWWGLNDLGGCPGIFDRETNKMLGYQLDAMLEIHLIYMKLQIDVLLDTNIPVIIITPMPVLGTLPWSHFDENNELVWENDYRCDFNLGLEHLVEAQRKLVADYVAEQKSVYLVDAWQVYKDHPNTDNMYMDIVHPGSQGAELIAERWLQVFQSTEK